MRGLFFNAQPTTDIVAHPSGFDREYDSDDFNRFMGVFFGNGVFVRQDADACKVTASGLVLAVTPGIALVDGGQCHFEPGDGLTITQGDGLYSVMCRRNNAAAVRAFELVAIRGEGEYPAPVRDGDLYDLCLAHVQVEDGMATVTDTREDRELCGFAALTGQPPYYPPDEANLPYVLWLYVLGLPMTPEQVEAVEGNPSLMEIFNQSRIVQETQRATKDEAEAGEDNSKLMTPANTKDAILHSGLFVKDEYGKKYILGVLPKIANGMETIDGGITIGVSINYYQPGIVETENYYVYSRSYNTSSNNIVYFIKKDFSEKQVRSVTLRASTYILGLSPIAGDKVLVLEGANTYPQNMTMVDLEARTKTTKPNLTPGYSDSALKTPCLIAIDENNFFVSDGEPNTGDTRSAHFARYSNGVKQQQYRFGNNLQNTTGTPYYLYAGHLYTFMPVEAFGYLNFKFCKISVTTGLVVGELTILGGTRTSDRLGSMFAVRGNKAYLAECQYQSSGVTQKRLTIVDMDTMQYLWEGSYENNSTGEMCGCLDIVGDYLYVGFENGPRRVYTIGSDGSLIFHSNFSQMWYHSLAKPVTTKGRPATVMNTFKGGLVFGDSAFSFPGFQQIYSFQCYPDKMSKTTPMAYPMAINDKMVLLANSATYNSISTIGIKDPNRQEVSFATEV